MSIESVTKQGAQQVLHKEPQPQGRFSKMLPSIAKRLSAVAIPALLLYAASNVSGADAGPVAYALCIAGCGPFAWVCMAACFPVLVAPTF